MIKKVEEFFLDQFNIIAVNESPMLKGPGPFSVVYKLPNTPLSVRRFLDESNSLNFIKYIIRLTQPSLNKTFSFPTFYVTEQDVEYRFVSGNESISFFRRENPYTKQTYVDTDGTQSYNYGIKILNPEDLNL